MGRPPMPIGTYGNIKVSESGPPFEARCRFRGADGTVRHVRRTGKSKTAAANRLKADLADLVAEARGAEIDRMTRFKVVAQAWHVEVDRRVELGKLSPNTARLYRGYLDNHILPALGELRMHEVTTTRADALIKAKQDAASYDLAKSVRAVVSGVCGYAVRHGALEVNPVREVARLERGATASPRALSAEERADILAQLDGDEKAASLDLPDLLRLMLATGVRLGELLALTGEDIDTDARTVHIAAHLIRVKGRGLVRVPRRKSGGELLLRVPEWSLPMLRRRKLAAGPYPLFPSLKDGWRDPSNVVHQLRRHLDRAGYEWVSSHVFRKTVATVLDEAGLPTTAVADQLGNSPAVAERHYRAKRAANAEQAQALEDIL